MNIIPPEFSVSRSDRERLNRHGSALLWFTGLSGSGKSTISQALDHRLYQMAVHSYVLDGDKIRTGLNGNLGFSREDREENLRRIAEVGALFVDAGMIVSTAFISPYRKDRDLARLCFRENNFIEIFVDTPLEECERRDVKGLYAKARRGDIKNFTGIDDPYETPQNPEIQLNTMELDVTHSVELIIQELKDRKILPEGF